MATAAAIAITFPGGCGWVAKPKMSALISVQLGSYHSAAAAFHPPRPLHSIPFIQRHGSIMYTHTRTHTNKHPHFSFCFFTTFLPPSLLFVHTHIQYVLHGNTHLHTHNFTRTSHCLSSPPPPPHTHIVPLSVLPQPFNHASVPLLFSSSQLENIFFFKIRFIFHSLAPVVFH